MVINQQYNIEALLACAFARSMKMMRYIDNLYSSDKERFYSAAKKSSRFKSRFITGNRIRIRLDAQKALGIIMAAQEDDAIKDALFANAEKAFRRIADAVSNSNVYAYVSDALFAGKVNTDMSDDNLHDTVALYVYFCEGYGLFHATDDPGYYSVMTAVFSKEIAYLKSYSEITAQAVKENGLEKASKELLAGFTNELKGRTLADVIGPLTDTTAPEFRFFTNMWDIAQLDNIPMSMYENEEFSKKDLQDIVNSFICNMGKECFDAADGHKYYIMALMLRSFARAYKEAEAMVDEYAGIVRDTKEQRVIAKEIAILQEKCNNQEQLLADKQAKLNELQMQYDRMVGKLAETEEKLDIEEEKTAALQQLLEEPQESEGTDDAERMAAIQRGSKAKAVVFGGTDSWQALVKNTYPSYTCIPVDDKDVNPKVIDKADVVVIKNDYLSHLQYNQVIARCRKKNKNVVYISNNLEMMAEKVGRIIYRSSSK